MKYFMEAVHSNRNFLNVISLFDFFNFSLMRFNLGLSSILLSSITMIYCNS